MQDLPRDIVGIMAGMLKINTIHALVDSLVLPEATQEWLRTRHACLGCKGWNVWRLRLCRTCYIDRHCELCGRTYREIARIERSSIGLYPRCVDRDTCKGCISCSKDANDTMIGSRYSYYHMGTFIEIRLCKPCYTSPSLLTDLEAFSRSFSN